MTMSNIFREANATVGVSAFRANLSGYIRRVKAGEMIAITKRGHEIARLIPLSSDKDADGGRL
jgi:prevent-host-death family protein